MKRIAFGERRLARQTCRWNSSKGDYSLRCDGFSLAELLIAVLFIGLFSGPLFLFLARLPEWRQRLGEQGQSEAAHSLQDRVLAQGLNPAVAPMARAAANPAMPEVEMPSIETEDIPANAKGIAVRSLRLRRDAAVVAEPRPGGAGWQLGAAAPAEPIVAPEPPLPPVYLTPPVLEPASGYAWRASDLVPPAQPGDPWVGSLRANSDPDLVVRLELTTPQRSISGLGTAVQRIDAWELSQKVVGRAWAEYAGNVDLGDRAETLPDGRRRWSTHREGRKLVVEPSQSIAFSQLLSLGPPVLVHGETELPSGSSEPIDYSDYLAIQEKRQRLQISCSQETRALFGNRWNSSLFGFTCTLHSSPGNVNGDLSPCFTSELAPTWLEQMPVETVVLGPVGVVCAPGQWSLQRRKRILEVPELIRTTAGDANGYALGSFGFAAPRLTVDGPRFGRLSARDGTLVSSGTEIDLLVLP